MISGVTASIMLARGSCTVPLRTAGEMRMFGRVRVIRVPAFLGRCIDHLYLVLSDTDAQ